MCRPLCASKKTKMEIDQRGSFMVKKYPLPRGSFIHQLYVSRIALSQHNLQSDYKYELYRDHLQLIQPNAAQNKKNKFVQDKITAIKRQLSISKKM